MEPVILVNFKTYEEAKGHKALELAEMCNNVAENFNADLRIAVEAPDIRMIASQVSIPVYAQHIDDVNPGSHTGWLLPEGAAEAGADGTLLNHSEHRLRMDVLEKTVRRAREVDMDVLICANNKRVAHAVDALDPDYVALEPPELIGGNTSVTDAEASLIRDASEAVDDLLVGAGVKNGHDVHRSMELDAKGVLLASGVVKADEPRRVLQDLVKGR